MTEWPWSRQISPYYEEVTAESSAWLKSFKPFTPASQYAFDKCDLGRLAALVYPDASREEFRIGVDLMNIVFLLDEYTDTEPAHAVHKIVDVVIDALHNPAKPRPEGEVVLGEIVRQFWSRGCTTATPEAERHFIETFTDYVRSVVTQAEVRDNAILHGIDPYLAIRRRDAGVRPSFMPGELHFSLPDEVFYHPIIRELEDLVVDLVVLDNDVVSYNKEQAAGDKHNLLIVAMRHLNTDFDGAMAWIFDFHKDVEARFHDALKLVPSFGPEMDVQVQAYINFLANWARGSYAWSFEGGRYFGSKGLEYQKTRLVPLLAERPRNPAARPELVEVQLIDQLQWNAEATLSIAVHA